MNEGPVIHHRRLLLLYGSRKKAWSLITKSLIGLESKQTSPLTGIIYNWPFKKKPDHHLQRELSNSAGPPLQLTTVNSGHTKPVLGRTVDFAILDLGRRFYPNDLGIVIETVRGGGFILLRLPLEDQWPTVQTYRPTNFEFSPLKSEKRPRFLSWLMDTLRACNHCEFVDLQEVDQISPLSISQESPFQHVRSPHDSSIRLELLPNQLLEIVKSGNQAEVLMAADEVVQYQESSKRRILAILANRGRGKSAALGMIAAGYLHWASQILKETICITISAPLLENVQEALKFAIRSLSVLGYEVKPDRDHRENILKLDIPEGTIEFLPPSLYDANANHLLLIDEAGGIPPALLKSMMRKSPLTILSSTVHGYEGVGRVFNRKVLSRIHRQPYYAVREITMDTPIRFPKGDPVEKWLFRALLLDAEPPKTPQKVTTRKNTDLSFVRLEKDQLFSINSEKMLRAIFGLYLYSHYRNQPNDLSLAADAPNYDVYMVLCPIKSQKAPLVAILGCWEGNLDEKTVTYLDRHPDTQGNIIPLTFLRYHDKNLAKLNGLRIVRIATHPDHQSEGLGGYALENLTKSITELGADWIGSSFGATPQLVRFWAAYGFQPIHIRPTPSPTTGEHSIVVIKGTSPKGQQAVERANADFLIRFSELLQSLYHELDAELAHQLLKSCSPIWDFPTRLTQSMRLRLWRYCWGQLYPVLVMEALRELAIWYFLCRPVVRLSRAQELILISRILQNRSWGRSMVKTHQTWIDAQGLLKKAIKRLLKAYEKQLASSQ
ncbi:MAG: GNAT family N-acetyltransferase [Candidatus Hodarchaeales archaeon]|jgi:tRNA(Met) cytidine acetyltransferase